MEGSKLSLKTKIVEIYERPPGYPELSEYCVVDIDVACREPIAWGFKIHRRLGEERFEALRQYGKVVCVSYSPYDSLTGEWALILKQLSPEEAIEKYGPITHQQFGPQGGWRSVTYGSTKFEARELKPSPELESNFPHVKEIIPRAGSKK